MLTERVRYPDERGELSEPLKCLPTLIVRTKSVRALGNSTPTAYSNNSHRVL